MSFSSFKVLVQKSYIKRAWDGYTYFATLTFYGRPEKEWELFITLSYSGLVSSFLRLALAMACHMASAFLGMARRHATPNFPHASILVAWSHIFFLKMMGALAGQVHTAFNNPTVCKAFSDVSIQLSLVQGINNLLGTCGVRQLRDPCGHAMGDLSRDSSGGLVLPEGVQTLPHVRHVG